MKTGKHMLWAALLAAAVSAPAFGQSDQSDQSGQAQAQPVHQNLTPQQTQLNQQLAPQQPVQIIQQPAASSSIGRLIEDIKGLARDVVKVDVPKSGNPAVHIKAPFVNVDVDHGKANVKVKAPFVNVSKDGDAPVSVQAPFTNVGTSPGAVNVQAPFTNVDSNGSVHIKAPFTSVDKSGAGNQADVKAPLVDIKQSN